MSLENRKEIMNLADMIQGEINRMCVTDDVLEFNRMSEYAQHNLLRLRVLIRASRFSGGEVEDD